MPLEVVVELERVLVLLEEANNHPLRLPLQLAPAQIALNHQLHQPNLRLVLDPIVQPSPQLARDPIVLLSPLHVREVLIVLHSQILVLGLPVLPFVQAVALSELAKAMFATLHITVHAASRKITFIFVHAAVETSREEFQEIRARLAKELEPVLVLAKVAMQQESELVLAKEVHKREVAHTVDKPQAKEVELVQESDKEAKDE